ncbi:hypothetical protein GS503_09315 [Rhodococcus hoagii]|nr:hypothetical protein [Prescottella equi]
MNVFVLGVLGLAVGTALVVPRVYLPSAAFVAFALFPVGYLEFPVTYGRFFTPAAVILIVWVVRVLLDKVRIDRWMLLLVCGTAAALVSSMLVNGFGDRSVSWSVLFLFCLPVAMIGAGNEKPEAYQHLASVIMVVGAVLACFALVESFFQFNPLGVWYTAGNRQLGQNWSVYRVQTTLGHPLVNALFFSSVGVFALFRAIKFPRAVSVVTAALLLAALVSTASRGGLTGYAVAGGAGVVVLVFSGGLDWGKKVATAVVLVVGLYLAFNSAIFQSRLNSGEAASSAQYRERVVDASMDMFREHPWFGVGPGSAQSTFDQFHSSLVVESSLLQLLVSLGVFGTAAIALVLVTGVVVALRRGRVEAAAACLAYVVGVSSYNAWDSNPAVVVLLAIFLIAACVCPIRSTGRGEALSEEEGERAEMGDVFANTKVVGVR